MQNQGLQTHQDRWSSLDDGRAVSLVRPSKHARPISFEANPKPVDADLSRSAMLIIDMQNDFLHQEGWFATTRKADVSPLSSVIDRTNTMSAAFRDAGVPIIHINWAVRPDAANLPANVLDKGSDCPALILTAVSLPLWLMAVSTALTRCWLKTRQLPSLHLMYQRRSCTLSGCSTVLRRCLMTFSQPFHHTTKMELTNEYHQTQLQQTCRSHGDDEFGSTRSCTG